MNGRRTAGGGEVNVKARPGDTVQATVRGLGVFFYEAARL